MSDSGPGQDSPLVPKKEALDSPVRTKAIEMLNEAATAHGVFETLTGQAIYERAVSFLNALPRSAFSPEISIDPDKEIAFDWNQDRKMLSVSLAAFGQLSFAADIEGCVFSGSAVFDVDLPVELFSMLVYFE